MITSKEVLTTDDMDMRGQNINKILLLTIFHPCLSAVSVVKFFTSKMRHGRVWLTITSLQALRDDLRLFAAVVHGHATIGIATKK